MNKHDSVPVKLYLQKHVLDWPTEYSLLTPVPGQPLTKKEIHNQESIKEIKWNMKTYLIHSGKARK